MDFLNTLAEQKADVKPIAPESLHLSTISIRGAREHNLKNIHLDIPRDSLVVITGVSGSGKSSLAFDTIYAEGQRRYVESLSAYARQFLDQLEKPDVDAIEGLSPAIAIDQKSTSRNPRSTVGTVTEIYDFLRLLFARVGKPHCPQCKEPISPQSVQSIMARILEFPAETSLAILAPMIRGRKGLYQKEFNDLRAQGFTRVRVDGEIRDLAEDIRLHRQKKHTVEVYVDRLKIKPGIESRLQESLEIAMKLAQGIVQVETLKPAAPQSLTFHEKFACLNCGRSFVELEPRLFSFNSPYGACQHCDGLGCKKMLDPELLIPDPGKSILQGAIQGIEPRFRDYFQKAFLAVIKTYGADASQPFEKLPKKVKNALLLGTGEEKISYSYQKENHPLEKPKQVKKVFEGLMPYLERRYLETDRDSLRLWIEDFMTTETCPSCQGRRLRQEALAVTLNGLTISQLSQFPIDECLRQMEDLLLNERQKIIADRILKEVKERLQFLLDVGLDYLSLDRGVVTLSGGESQRIRLATQVGSELVGVLYILDEPSIGLHPRDNHRLLKNLEKLRDSGNTVLVVEHDEETIRRADFIVDMGPGAGRNGGEVVVAGSPQDIEDHPYSLTGKFLTGKEKIAVPKERRKWQKSLMIRKAQAHNLKNIDVEIPLGVLVCVTGVSGSGKSTLVKDTLFQWFRRRLYKAKTPTQVRQIDTIEGAEQIDKVIHIDQKPIGRSPRSNPATYSGILSLIREFFAQLPTSRMRGWKAGRFSFNVKGGRCEECQGNGLKKIEMHFLPDIYVRCEVCRGKRFSPETLSAKFRGASIADVLDMTVSEALLFFENVPMIRAKLQILLEVGMGYITLGQSATTLSGGEAQRMKLSRELAKRSTGKTLYILDEPTTGLHFADIGQLLEIFHRLVEQKNTLVVIEHNLDVIKCADYILDLGPGGGDEGGELIATGTPEEIAKNPRSLTGKFLQPVLAKN